MGQFIRKFDSQTPLLRTLVLLCSAMPAQNTSKLLSRWVNNASQLIGHLRSQRGVFCACYDNAQGPVSVDWTATAGQPCNLPRAIVVCICRTRMTHPHLRHQMPTRPLLGCRVWTPLTLQYRQHSGMYKGTRKVTGRRMRKSSVAWFVGCIWPAAPGFCKYYSRMPSSSLL